MKTLIGSQAFPLTREGLIVSCQSSGLSAGVLMFWLFGTREINNRRAGSDTFVILVPNFCFAIFIGTILESIFVSIMKIACFVLNFIQQVNTYPWFSAYICIELSSTFSSACFLSTAEMYKLSADLLSSQSCSLSFANQLFVGFIKQWSLFFVNCDLSITKVGKKQLSKNQI